MKIAGFSRIVFWQVMPSPHQLPALAAFADIADDTEVLVICDRNMETDLSDLGWQTTSVNSLNLRVAIPESEATQLIVEDVENTLHILNGIYFVPSFKRALTLMQSIGSPYGILAEGREYLGLKGKARLLHSRIADRKTARLTKFVLAMGSVGKNWYIRSGYHENNVFDYIYTPLIQTGLSVNAPIKEDFEIIFVGRLEPRKRVDLLLQAFARLRSEKLILKIVGNGDSRIKLQNLASSLGIEHRVYWKGVVRNENLATELRTADLLVLPSRWDGWGAVVNEALLCGVPVVCSDTCGAGVILDGTNSMLGSTFKSGSVVHLAQTIKMRIEIGKLSNRQRGIIKKWANRNISGEAAALYLKNVFEFVFSNRGEIDRPLAPWLRRV